MTKKQKHTNQKHLKRRIIDSSDGSIGNNNVYCPLDLSSLNIIGGKMAKREKFSIFGRHPDTKKGCYEFMQKKKKEWGVDYFLNDEEIKHMKDLMSNYYLNLSITFTPIMVNIISETIMNARFKNPLPDSIEPTAEVSNVKTFGFPLSSIPCR